jgi:hypothetical protein
MSLLRSRRHRGGDAHGLGVTLVTGAGSVDGARTVAFRCFSRDVACVRPRASRTRPTRERCASPPARRGERLRSSSGSRPFSITRGSPRDANVANARRSSTDAIPRPRHGPARRARRPSPGRPTRCPRARRPHRSSRSRAVTGWGRSWASRPPAPPTPRRGSGDTPTPR